MRTIKFRGKRLDSKEWVTGCYNLDTKGGQIVTYVDDCHVWSETIGEFTGLNDTNEKEIYEGDIVASINSKGQISSYGIVTFGTYDIGCNGGEYSFMIHGWYVSPISNNGGDAEYLTYLLIDGDMTIIGNIHDNPEMLKEE